MRLDKFADAYVTCALWSSTDNADESGGEPLDKNYSADDIAPETMVHMVADCDAFRKLAGDLLDGIDEGQAGHDFWLTRNGHGAGFWDRGLGERGDKLSELCKPFGPVEMYACGDGKVRMITFADLLASKESLDQVRYYHRVGRITDEVFRAYLHEWQTSAPRFSVQACRCASCLAPANKVEEDF